MLEREHIHLIGICGTAMASLAGMLEAVILRVLGGFRGPIGIGLRSGHVSRANVTLPFGIEAELALEGEPTLRFLEAAVRN